MSSRKEVIYNAFTNSRKEVVVQRITNDVKESRVLIIGDLHEPFTLKEYLPFCKSIYKKYKCNKVVFIGDIIDNNFSSYHEINSDGLSADQELSLAINNIAQWYKAFPNAYVTIGNHDKIIMRKAQTAGLSQHWVKDFNTVLNTPGWIFVDSVEIDNVFYTHGTVDAYTRAKRDLCSIVSGHLHTKAGIQFYCGRNYRIFGMQVGSGVDRASYALAYAYDFPKQIIACGVVLNNGKLPIVEPMEL